LKDISQFCMLKIKIKLNLSFGRDHLFLVVFDDVLEIFDLSF
jgi:hypothetical protein